MGTTSLHTFWKMSSGSITIPPPTNLVSVNHSLSPLPSQSSLHLFLPDAITEQTAKELKIKANGTLYFTRMPAASTASDVADTPICVKAGLPKLRWILPGRVQTEYVWWVGCWSPYFPDKPIHWQNFVTSTLVRRERDEHMLIRCHPDRPYYYKVNDGTHRYAFDILGPQQEKLTTIVQGRSISTPHHASYP